MRKVLTTGIETIDGFTLATAIWWERRGKVAAKADFQRFLVRFRAKMTRVPFFGAGGREPGVNVPHDLRGTPGGASGAT
jgi:hypothetical protein